MHGSDLHVRRRKDNLWGCGRRDPHLETNQTDAGDVGLAEGAPEPGVVDPGEQGQFASGVGEQRRVVHNLGPEEALQTAVHVRDHGLQAGHPQRLGVPGPDSRLGPQNHLLVEIRRADNPLPRGLTERAQLARYHG